MPWLLRLRATDRGSITSRWGSRYRTSVRMRGLNFFKGALNKIPTSRKAQKLKEPTLLRFLRRVLWNGTLDEMAAETGLSAATLSRLERGLLRNPGKKATRELEREFGVPISDLLGPVNEEKIFEIVFRPEDLNIAVA